MVPFLWAGSSGPTGPEQHLLLPLEEQPLEVAEKPRYVSCSPMSYLHFVKKTYVHCRQGGKIGCMSPM